MTVTAGPAVTLRCKAQIAAGTRFPGLCLKRTRLALGIPAKYPSAIAAWRAVPPSKRHPGQGPEGFPTFYDLSQFGHIVNSSEDKGYVYSQIGVRAIVQKVKYTYFTRPLGYTTSLNGVDIIAPPVGSHAKPPAVPSWHAAKYPGRVMRVGAKGDAVKSLQFHLGLKVTGKYDKALAAAVDGFVRARNRKYGRGNPGYLGLADGTAGPKTYRAITGK